MFPTNQNSGGGASLVNPAPPVLNQPLDKSRMPVQTDINSHSKKRLNLYTTSANTTDITKVTVTATASDLDHPNAAASRKMPFLQIGGSQAQPGSILNPISTVNPLISNSSDVTRFVPQAAAAAELANEASSWNFASVNTGPYAVLDNTLTSTIAVKKLINQAIDGDMSTAYTDLGHVQQRLDRLQTQALIYKGSFGRTDQTTGAADQGDFNLSEILGWQFTESGKSPNGYVYIVANREQAGFPRRSGEPTGIVDTTQNLPVTQPGLNDDTIDTTNPSQPTPVSSVGGGQQLSNAYFLSSWSSVVMPDDDPNTPSGIPEGFRQTISEFFYPVEQIFSDPAQFNALSLVQSTNLDIPSLNIGDFVIVRVENVNIPGGGNEQALQAIRRDVPGAGEPGSSIQPGIKRIRFNFVQRNLEDDNVASKRELNINRAKDAFTGVDGIFSASLAPDPETGVLVAAETASMAGQGQYPGTFDDFRSLVRGENSEVMPRSRFVDLITRKDQQDPNNQSYEAQRAFRSEDENVAIAEENWRDWTTSISDAVGAAHESIPYHNLLLMITHLQYQINTIARQLTVHLDTQSVASTDPVTNLLVQPGVIASRRLFLNLHNVSRSFDAPGSAAVIPPLTSVLLNVDLGAGEGVGQNMTNVVPAAGSSTANNEIFDVSSAAGRVYSSFPYSDVNDSNHFLKPDGSRTRYQGSTPLHPLIITLRSEDMNGGRIGISLRSPLFHNPAAQVANGFEMAQPRFVLKLSNIYAPRGDREAVGSLAHTEFSAEAVEGAIANIGGPDLLNAIYNNQVTPASFGETAPVVADGDQPGNYPRDIVLDETSPLTINEQISALHNNDFTVTSGDLQDIEGIQIIRGVIPENDDVSQMSTDGSQYITGYMANEAPIFQDGGPDLLVIDTANTNLLDKYLQIWVTDSRVAVAGSPVQMPGGSTIADLYPGTDGYLKSSLYPGVPPSSFISSDGFPDGYTLPQSSTTTTSSPGSIIIAFPSQRIDGLRAGDTFTDINGGGTQITPGGGGTGGTGTGGGGTGTGGGGTGTLPAETNTFDITLTEFQGGGTVEEEQGLLAAAFQIEGTFVDENGGTLVDITPARDVDIRSVSEHANSEPEPPFIIEAGTTRDVDTNGIKFRIIGNNSSVAGRNDNYRFHIERTDFIADTAVGSHPTLIAGGDDLGRADNASSIGQIQAASYAPVATISGRLEQVGVVTDPAGATSSLPQLIIGGPTQQDPVQPGTYSIWFSAEGNGGTPGAPAAPNELGRFRDAEFPHSSLGGGARSAFIRLQIREP